MKVAPPYPPPGNQYLWDPHIAALVRTCRLRRRCIQYGIGAQHRYRPPIPSGRSMSFTIIEDYAFGRVMSHSDATIARQVLERRFELNDCTVPQNSTELYEDVCPSHRDSQVWRGDALLGGVLVRWRGQWRGRLGGRSVVGFRGLQLLLSSTLTRTLSIWHSFYFLP
jgi:hypothetical protein